jgi:hypothetical protein
MAIIEIESLSKSYRTYQKQEGLLASAGSCQPDLPAAALAGKLDIDL